MRHFLKKFLYSKLQKMEIWTSNIAFLNQKIFMSIWLQENSILLHKFAKLWIFHFGIGLLNSLKAKKALSQVTLHQKSSFFGVFRQILAIFAKTFSLYLQICSWMITHSKNLVFKSWKNFVKSSSSSQSILRETKSDMC